MKTVSLLDGNHNSICTPQRICNSKQLLPERTASQYSLPGIVSRDSYRLKTSGKVHVSSSPEETYFYLRIVKPPLCPCRQEVERRQRLFHIQSQSRACRLLAVTDFPQQLWMEAWLSGRLKMMHAAKASREANLFLASEAPLVFCVLFTVVCPLTWKLCLPGVPLSSIVRDARLVRSDSNDVHQMSGKMYRHLFKQRLRYFCRYHSMIWL